MRKYYFGLIIFILQASTPLSLADDQNKMQGTFGEPWNFGSEITVSGQKGKADPWIPGIYFRGASLGGKSKDNPVFVTHEDLFSIGSGVQMRLIPIPKYNPGESPKSYSKRFKDGLCDKGRPKVRAVEHISYKPPKVEVGTSVEVANQFQRETLKNVRNFLAEGKLFLSTGVADDLHQMYFSQRVTAEKVTLAMQGYTDESLHDLGKFFSNQRWPTTTNFGGTHGVAGSAQMMLLVVLNSIAKEENIVVPSISPVAFDMSVVKRNRSTSVISGKASIEDTLEPIDKDWVMSTPYPSDPAGREFIKTYISKDIYFLKDGKKFYPAFKWHYQDLLILKNGYVPLIPLDVQRAKFINKEAGPTVIGEEGGKLSTQQALSHKDYLWELYFKYFSKVTEAPDRRDPDKINFEITLDLEPFCRWGTAVSDLVVTE